MKWLVKSVALIVASVMLIGPALTNVPPPKPPKNTKPIKYSSAPPSTPAVRIQRSPATAGLVQRTNEALGKYTEASQRVERLNRTIQERLKKQADLKARWARIDQSTPEGKQQLVAINQEYARYVARYKNPALAAEAELPAAHAEAVKTWQSYKAATQALSQSVGVNTQLRDAARKARDVRALERDFPILPVDSAPGGTPSAGANVSDVSTTANPVTAPASPAMTPDQRRQMAQQAIDAARARSANRPLPKLPVPQPETVVQYEQLPPNYRSIPPGTQKP